MTEQEEEYVFYHEIGFALQKWSILESMLLKMCACCGTTRGESACIAVGFTSIENFRSKLAYVDTYMQHWLGRNQALRNRWGDLHKRIYSASARRNEIAHRQPTKFKDEPSGKRIGLLEPGWYIKPITTSDPHEHRNPITIREIALRSIVFENLSIEIDGLCYVVRGLSEPDTKSLLRAERPPTIRQIENRMREVHGRQPRPSRAKS